MKKIIRACSKIARAGQFTIKVCACRSNTSLRNPYLYIIPGNLLSCCPPPPPPPGCRDTSIAAYQLVVHELNPIKTKKNYQYFIGIWKLEKFRDFFSLWKLSTIFFSSRTAWNLINVYCENSLDTLPRFFSPFFCWTKFN